jgi:hypothetical protein
MAFSCTQVMWEADAGIWVKRGEVCACAGKALAAAANALSSRNLRLEIIRPVLIINESFTLVWGDTFVANGSRHGSEPVEIGVEYAD